MVNFNLIYFTIAIKSFVEEHILVLHAGQSLVPLLAHFLLSHFRNKNY